MIGEEFGTDHPDAEFVWVLDPIDGTKSFHHRRAALRHAHRAAARRTARARLPSTNRSCGQLMLGDGPTTTLNGRARARAARPHASRRPRCSTAIRSTPAKYQNGAALRSPDRPRANSSARGAIATATCWSPAGWADVMCDPIMNPWDIAALIPIVRGAGGVITDWQGGDPVNANRSSPLIQPCIHRSSQLLTKNNDASGQAPRHSLNHRHVAGVADPGPASPRPATSESELFQDIGAS